MKSYEEIDQENQPVRWRDFFFDLGLMILFSVFFAWVIVYALPDLMMLVIR